MHQQIPDLTEEQKSKLEELHLNVMKEALPIRNQLNENNAKYRNLDFFSTIFSKHRPHQLLNNSNIHSYISLLS